MFRGSLIAMIFDKTLRIDSSAVKDAEAITLMSADIDRIASSMPLIHELYASFIETGVALYLLYRLLGLAIVAPIVWIVGRLCIPNVQFNYSNPPKSVSLPAFHSPKPREMLRFHGSRRSRFASRPLPKLSVPRKPSK